MMSIIGFFFQLIIILKDFNDLWSISLGLGLRNAKGKIKEVYFVQDFE